MSRKILFQRSFSGGISEAEKVGIPGAFLFGQKLNIFGDPSQVSILPAAVKESGTVVTALIKWLVPGTPHDTNLYGYDEAGHIYKRTSGGTWTDERTVANSKGQGMDVYNDYLYYTQNTQLGRYGLLSGSPSFTDAFATGLNDTSGSTYAPVKAFNGFVYAGHGNKLLQTDGTTTTVAKLTLPVGLNIRSLEVLDEFLVIGTWRGTSITGNEEGYLFFWDGTATNYNYFVKIEDGGCNALLNSRNRLLSVVGSSGFIYMNYNPFQKLQQLPKLVLGKYVEVLPGAVTSWRGQAIIGFAGNTDSADIYHGAYQWGAISEKYPEVLNYAWPISTGTQTGTGVRIGALRGAGSNLFMAWKDGSSYGVDKIVNSASPYSSATMENLIFDDQRNGENKKAVVVKVSHLALVSGESIQIGYKTNRASSYTTGAANSTVDTIATRLPVDFSKASFNEFQFEFILATTGSTSPKVTGAALEYDDLKEEKDF